MKSDCLLVLDSRTGQSYQIPIKDNYINASDVSKIAIPDVLKTEDAEVQVNRPLRLLDRGFENTACGESSITLM
jgi:citrate synthase